MPGERDERLRAIALPRVRLVAIAMVLSLALAGVWAAVALRELTLALTCFIPMAAAAGVWIALRADRIPAGRATLVVFLLWLCVVTAVLGASIATPHPHYDAILAALATGYGAVQLERRYVVLAFALLAPAWIAHNIYTDDQFGEVLVVASIALGLLSHAGERRFMHDVDRLHDEADARAAELARALAAAEREIEDRKRAEAERAQAEAERERVHEQFVAAQRMEAIGTLAGGVAHDLNNVLAVIMGVAEYVQSEVSAELQAEIAQITEACQRGADLTRNLVAYARGGRYRNERVQLHDVAKHVSRLLQRSIPKRVELRVDLGPATVVGDAAQLGQVVLNLCLNSVDAISDHGEIAVAVHEVELADPEASRLELPPGRYARLRVADTGTGMEPAVAARIFEPFFTTKAVGHGSGLGLAMVYGTIRAHHGAIDVRSAPGEGTTMAIYIPVAPALGSQATPPGSPVATPVATGSGILPLPPRGPRPVARPRVLVIDDEPSVRNATQRLLEAEGYEVVAVDSGETGVEIYRQRPGAFAVVLLDMAMPGMNGRECFTRLRAIDPAARILIASGYSSSVEAQACLKEGALGYLSKPVARTALAAAVATAARGQRVGAMVELT